MLAGGHCLRERRQRWRHGTDATRSDKATARVLVRSRRSQDRPSARRRDREVKSSTPLSVCKNNSERYVRASLRDNVDELLHSRVHREGIHLPVGIACGVGRDRFVAQPHLEAVIRARGEDVRPLLLGHKVTLLIDGDEVAVRRWQGLSVD